MKSDSELIQQWKEHRASAKNGLADQYQHIEECQRAYNGDMVSYTGKVSLLDKHGSRRSTQVSFNKIKPYVSAIKGFFAQNRRKPQFVAKIDAKEEQEAYSEYCNGLYSNIRENANADQIETAADSDMLICGVGAVETNLVYGDGYATRNPNGEIEMMVLDPLACGWDPTARMPNLIDSRFAFFQRKYRVQEALDLFDKSEPQDFEEVDASRLGPEISGTGGGMFTNLRELFDVDDEEKKIVNVYFYQWFDVEKYYRAVNPLKMIADPVLLQIMIPQLERIAAEQEFPDDPFALRVDDEVISCDAATKAKIIQAFDGISIEWDELNRRVYQYAVLSGKKIFCKGRSISQNGFTIQFKTGDWNSTKRVWTGIVGNMIDPQMYFNKALTELLYAIASASKGGVMAEQNAITDIAAFEASYAKTDGVAIVADGALTGNKIKPKREAYSPNGVEELLEIADRSISETAGVDKAFLGSSDNALETASLQRQRIKQVAAVLAPYADAITLFQRLHARLMCDLMRAYVENNEGEMFRVMDEDTGDYSFVPMSVTRLYDKYDLTIMEAPDSATEKQERAVLLNKMGDSLLTVDPDSAKIVYAMSVKYMPLEAADKALLRKTFMPDEQAIDPAYVKQLENQLAELTSEPMKAQTMLMKSQAAKNLASIEEMHSKIRNTNMDTTKKRTEAQKNIVQAADIAGRPAERLPKPANAGDSLNG